MLPRKNEIGIELDYSERQTAELALAIANNRRLKGLTMPISLASEEITLLSITRTQSLLTNRTIGHSIVEAAGLAQAESNQRLWQANNGYFDMKHNNADEEILEAAQMDIDIEISNVEMFRSLQDSADKALGKSIDFAIERGLAKSA